VRPEGLDKLEKCIRLIGVRNHDLPAYSIMPQPLRYREQGGLVATLFTCIPDVLGSNLGRTSN
jgi:hypothetical protein